MRGAIYLGVRGAAAPTMDEEHSSRSTPAGVEETSHAVGAPRLPVDNDGMASKTRGTKSPREAITPATPGFAKAQNVLAALRGAAARPVDLGR